jgi:hypothetical protein
MSAFYQAGPQVQKRVNGAKNQAEVETAAPTPPCALPFSLFTCGLAHFIA